MFNLHFPAIREVGNPKRKTVETKEEFFTLVKANNGKNNLYTTVYYFLEKKEYRPNYDSAVIDKLFFDFDPKIVFTSDKVEIRPDNGYHDFITVFDYCIKNDLRCIAISSGSGYHLYVECEFNEEVKDKKALIYNAQTDFIRKVNSSLKEENWGVVNIDNGKVVSKFHLKEVAKLKAKNLGERYVAADLTVKIDHRTLGKPDQLARIPYTYNLKRNRYCIPLFENTVKLGDETIKKLSADKSSVKEMMKRKIQIFGNKKWNINRYNTGKHKFDEKELLPYKIGGEIPNTVIGEVPLCIKSLLKQDSLGWDLRRVEIIWLRDNGYLLDEVNNILKNQLTKKRRHGHRMSTDYEHCTSIHDGNQPLSLFKREDMLFPTWESLKQMGLCPFKEKKECALNKFGCMMYNRGE
jgi:hypothetical protein